MELKTNSILFRCQNPNYARYDPVISGLQYLCISRGQSKLFRVRATFEPICIGHIAMFSYIININIILFYLPVQVRSLNAEFLGRKGDVLIVLF